MTSKKYLKLFFALAAFSLIADLASKYVVFKWLYHVPGREYNLIPKWFKFTAQFEPSQATSENSVVNSLQTWSAPEMPYVNKGALFGVLQNQKELANGLFALISAIAAVAILIWVIRSKVTCDAWVAAALGMILGGAIGNFYDRIIFHGVRDFLYFYWFEWPVFNFADCCLVVGTFILVVHSFLFQETQIVTSQTASTTLPESIQQKTSNAVVS